MDRLWQITEKENIRVIYKNLLGVPEKPNGLYVYDPRTGPMIILGNHLVHDRRLHKCVFAEEIGHFYTAPRTNLLMTYTSANLSAMMDQDERKAMQWATDFLIPDVELSEALKVGYRSCYELAEYFDVTEWFMYRKLGLMKMCFRRTGLKVKGRDMFDIEMKPCNLI